MSEDSKNPDRRSRATEPSRFLTQQGGLSPETIDRLQAPPKSKKNKWGIDPNAREPIDWREVGTGAAIMGSIAVGTAGVLGGAALIGMDKRAALKEAQKPPAITTTAPSDAAQPAEPRLFSDVEEQKRRTPPSNDNVRQR